MFTRRMTGRTEKPDREELRHGGRERFSDRPASADLCVDVTRYSTFVTRCPFDQPHQPNSQPLGIPVSTISRSARDVCDAFGSLPPWFNSAGYKLVAYRDLECVYAVVVSIWSTICECVIFPPLLSSVCDLTSYRTSHRNLHINLPLLP